MSREDLEILRDILHRMEARYLTVRPHGIETEPDRPPLKTLEVYILNHGGARSLYRGRRPVCRSLDGIRALKDPNKLCGECFDRKHCTPQVRVDLLHENRPYRLVLAFSSARNVLRYEARCKANPLPLHRIRTRITVINRSTWGELKFLEAGSEE